MDDFFAGFFSEPLVVIDIAGHFLEAALELLVGAAPCSVVVAVFLGGEVGKPVRVFMKDEDPGVEFVGDFLERGDHLIQGGAGGGGAGDLSHFVLIGLLAVVLIDSGGGSAGTISFLSLIDHGDVADINVAAVSIFNYVRPERGAGGGGATSAGGFYGGDTEPHEFRLVGFRVDGFLKLEGSVAFFPKSFGDFDSSVGAFVLGAVAGFGGYLVADLGEDTVEFAEGDFAIVAFVEEHDGDASYFVGIRR